VARPGLYVSAQFPFDRALGCIRATGERSEPGTAKRNSARKPTWIMRLGGGFGDGSEDG
jgi:hypothetical protein